MARIRSIQPDFPYTHGMRNISRDARLLRALLPIFCDDEGRRQLDLEDLLERAFPGDPDAGMMIGMWISELERVGVIECYDVDGVKYLRIVHWHEEQQVSHPRPSAIPRSPKERPGVSGNSGISGNGRRRSAKVSRDQALADRSGAFPESDQIFIDDSPVVLDRQGLLRDLRRIRQNAEADGSHTAAIRAAEAMARYGGLKPIVEDSVATTPEAREAARLPSPEEANGVVPGAGSM